MLAIQNELLMDDSLRFVAINLTLRLSRKDKFLGIDGKKTINYKDRFELQELLKLKGLDWELQMFKTVDFSENFKKVTSHRIFTIADRVWQTSIALLLIPAQQAFFHPRSVGFREGYSIADVKKIFEINTNKEAGGLHKRVLILKFHSSFPDYNKAYLLKKILAGKKVKRCISRSLDLGLIPEFVDESLNLPSLLANILLNGIENIHSCVRFGNNIAFFLNPSDSEGIIMKKVNAFTAKAGIGSRFTELIIKDLLSGVDFCGWNFRISSDGQFISGPSFYDYQLFTKRIKNIVNNSNYGAVRI